MLRTAGRTVGTSPAKSSPGSVSSGTTPACCTPGQEGKKKKRIKKQKGSLTRSKHIKGSKERLYIYIHTVSESSTGQENNIAQPKTGK